MSDRSPTRGLTGPGGAIDLASPRGRLDWRHLCLALVLILGLAVRFWHLSIGFSEFHVYANDEIFEVNRALQLLRGDYDFLRFGKGFYFYLLVPVFGLLGLIQIATGRFDDLGAFVSYHLFFPAELILVSRALTATIGTLTVYLLFRLGERVFPRRAWAPELLLALAWSTCALAAWEARWGLVETTLAGLGVLAFFPVLAILRMPTPSRRTYALAAAAIAAAGATKLYGLLLVIPLALAQYLGGSKVSARRRLARLARPRFLGALALLALLYVALNPSFAVFSLSRVDLAQWQQVEPAAPPTLGERPVSFYLTRVRWYLGTPLLPFVALGVLGAIRRRQREVLLCAVFGLSFVGLLLLAKQAFLIYQRYLLLPLPFLFVTEIYGILVTIDFLAERRRPLERLFGSFALPTLAALFLMWNGLDSLFRRPPYRERYEVIQNVAGRWFLDTVAPGSRVLLAGKGPWPGHQTLPLFDLGENYRRKYLGAVRGQRWPKNREVFDALSVPGVIPRYDLIVVEPDDTCGSLSRYLELGVDYFVIDQLEFEGIEHRSTGLELGSYYRIRAKSMESRRRLYAELRRSDQVRLLRRFSGRTVTGGPRTIEIFARSAAYGAG